MFVSYSTKTRRERGDLGKRETYRLSAYTTGLLLSSNCGLDERNRDGIAKIGLCVIEKKFCFNPYDESL